MPVSILLNAGGNFISGVYSKNRGNLEKNQTQLASGLRAPDPALDPSGAAIGIQRSGEIVVAQVVQSIASQGAALMSLGVGVLDSIASILTRMRDLATQARSDTIDESSRNQLDQEYQQLFAQIDLNAKTTWGSQKLFDNDSQMSGNIQVGLGVDQQLEFTFEDMSTTALGVTTSIAGADGSTATDAFSTISDALGTVLDHLALVASYKSRLDIVNESMGNLAQNLSIAKSTYTDVNITDALINAQRSQALVDAGGAAMQQNVQIFSKMASLIQRSLT